MNSPNSYSKVLAGGVRMRWRPRSTSNRLIPAVNRLSPKVNDPSRAGIENSAIKYRACCPVRFDLTEREVRYLVISIAAFLAVCGQPAFANEATNCFEKAWAHPSNGGLGLTRGQATRLCNGATRATEVTKCYDKAWGHPNDKGLGLTAGLAVELCSGTINANETTKCYAKAWGHPNNGGLGLTAGGAVDLCKSTPVAR